MRSEVSQQPQPRVRFPRGSLLFPLAHLGSFLLWKHIREAFPALKGQKTLWSLSQQFVGAIVQGQGANNWPLRVSRYQPLYYRHTALSDNCFSKGKIPVMTKGLGVTPHLHLGLITGELKRGLCIIPSHVTAPQDGNCLSLSNLRKLWDKVLRPLLPFPSRLWAGCHFWLWSFLRLGNIVISW